VTFTRAGSSIVDLPDVPAHELAGGGTSATLRLPADGLVLGTDEQAAPVAIRFFREQPGRVRMFADSPLAQQVVLRALALGARVSVLCDEVARWTPLVRALPRPTHGAAAVFTVLPSAGQVPDTATAAVPSLVVRATVGHRDLQPGPWQTVLAADAVTDLSPTLLDDLRDYQLLLTERVPPFAVQRIREMFGLPYDRAVWLSQLAEGRIAVVSPGQMSLVDVPRSAAERALLGG
jgi:ESX secretion system protein EccE